MNVDYEKYKPLLFSLAYHILGNVMDAEDAVQEVFLSVQERSGDSIQNMKSYLCRSVHNRCINLLNAASRQRETYIGPWLPEPLLTEGIQSENPLESYVRKESLSTAYLLLMQQLSATERIVYVLREAFRFPFEDIAGIVDKSSNNCRQLYYRAKSSLGDTSSRNVVVPDKKNHLVEQFTRALTTGNIGLMVDILSTESVLFMDGGGKVRVALRPIYGPDFIMRYFEAVRPDVPPFTSVIQEINGQPGVILIAESGTFAAITFDWLSDKIVKIYTVMNPEKLRHFNKQI
jgi:RNA polymerase sigma-70 factor (ECF subfamily)